MEIERKFLVNSLSNLEFCSFKELRQGYLSFDPEIRIRSINNKEFYLSHKTNGDLMRVENESFIDSSSFQILTNLVQGRVITKTRYYVYLTNSLMAELDFYHAEFEGLVTVETEFQSEEAANNFEIPIWYGKEITYDKRYKNKNLARCSDNELKELLSESVSFSKIRK